MNVRYKRNIMRPRECARVSSEQRPIRYSAGRPWVAANSPTHASRPYITVAGMCVHTPRREINVTLAYRDYNLMTLAISYMDIGRH